VGLGARWLCSVSSESRCGCLQGEGVGPMRTKADKGEGESILADILRTSFMDDPIEVY